MLNNQPIRPPFSEETARKKVQAAEDAWNSRDPERTALAYTEDSEWRNRNEFLHGRKEIVEFLRRKWAKELDYRLKKTLWCYNGNRIASYQVTVSGDRNNPPGTRYLAFRGTRRELTGRDFPTQNGWLPTGV